MKKVLLSLLMSGVAFVANAKVEVPVSSQTNLNVSIYKNFAFIQDEREVDLVAGRQEILFVDVSNQMHEQSVMVSAPNLVVKEQNFNFDLLSYDNLLSKSVGQTVGYEWVNQGNGQISRGNAELLAYNGGHPVLKIDGKINPLFRGTILFDKVPENVYAKPTMTIDVVTKNAAKHLVKMSYLTEGLSWRASYVGNLDLIQNKMQLSAMVTLTNNTAVSFKNANLNLIAGDVNLTRPQEFYHRASSGGGMSAWGAATTSNMETEQVSGYHMYSLPNKTDIMTKQTKQVSMFDAPAVYTKQEYKYYSDLYLAYSDSKIENVKPDIVLSFENEKKDGLGMPLPAGVFNIYQQDSKGKQVFVGSDRIEHTAKGQKVSLTLGKDFDITINGNIVKYEEKPNKTRTIAARIEIKNPKKEAVNLLIYQAMPENWRMISETYKSKKETALQVVWDIPIGPDSTAVLDFEIEAEVVK